MNNTPNYAPGITADEAKFQKSLVDANHQLNPLEKLMAKQAISIRIADPIDRECELRCDRIDFDQDIAQGCAHQMLGYSFCGNLANDLIVAVSKMSTPKRKPFGTTVTDATVYAS